MKRSIFSLIALFLLLTQVNASGLENTESNQSKDIIGAAAQNDTLALKQLINDGADLNAREPMMQSTPLMTAIVFNSYESARMLIDAGAELNVKNKDGSTALITAAFFGRTEMVKLLLDSGADKSITNNYGSTALQTVEVEFANIKPVYEAMLPGFNAMGVKISIKEIEAARPKIAELLKK